MKKCRDCKWSRVGWIERLVVGWMVAKCHHPLIGHKEGEMDYTTGIKGKDDWWFCGTLREGPCGPEGRYFEKKDEWTRFFPS
jgi:hypothetical protein